MKKLINAFGWYGAVAILAAYFLNSFGLIKADSAAYQLLNVTGAVGIVLVSYVRRAYQPMALNAVWTVIGLVALAKIFLRV
ncbi:MAG TPA: hypothetical protein VL426_03365 [Candidatus Binatia bacterium]|jgi:hypothetical protein|nr:hypothetical protein [Candidatus Binatia bacterium]